MLCFLEELLEDSAEMRPITGKRFLEEGIDELQDILVAEDYNNNTVGNLSLKVNLNDDGVINELTQIESKLERINVLMDQVREKVNTDYQIKIGVEVNE
jgi:hypothetical protein